jgi:hypothetical protein
MSMSPLSRVALVLLALCVPVSIYLNAFNVHFISRGNLTAQIIGNFMIESFLRACNSPSGWWMSSQVFGFVCSLTVFAISESHRFGISRLWILLCLLIASLSTAVSAVSPIIFILWAIARSKHRASSPAPYLPPLHFASAALVPALSIAVISLFMMTNFVSGPPSFEFIANLTIGKLVLLVPVLIKVGNIMLMQFSSKDGKSEPPTFTSSAVRLTTFYAVLALSFWILHMKTIISLLGEVYHRSPVVFTSASLTSPSGFLEMIKLYGTVIYDRAFGESAFVSQTMMAYDAMLLYAECSIFFVAFAGDICAGMTFALFTITWLPLHVVFPAFLIFQLWDEHTRFSPKAQHPEPSMVAPMRPKQN